MPPDISDLIQNDHICYLVIAIVNSIDVSEIENCRGKKLKSSTKNIIGQHALGDETAHNLKVMWGKLERNVPVIGTIRNIEKVI